MRDVTDNRTGELEVGEVKRGRGRPRKADAMTNAERQAAYRARRRASVTVTKNAQAQRLIVDQVDAYDECRLEVDQLRAELAEVKQREQIAWREMRQQRDAREVLSREVADLNREFVQLVDERSKAFAENDRLRAELAAAKNGAAKSVTGNGNPVSFEDMLELLAAVSKARTLSERLAIREDEDGVYYRAIVRTTAVSQAQMEQVAAAIRLGPKKTVTRRA